MSSNSFVTLSSLTIIGLGIASRIIVIPYVAHLLLLVTCILYLSCHLSLQLRQDQALARGEVDPNIPPDTPSSTVEVTSETLKKEDAMKMPLLGSISLFTLYLAFKFFDKDTVNFIISIYFGAVGCFALTVTGTSLLSSPYLNFVGKNLSRVSFHKEFKIRHSLPTFIGGESPWDLSIRSDLVEVVSFIASGIFTVMYLQQKKWWMNNIVGVCLCIMGIQQVSVGSYKIGAIMLVGLFFYDIFWVFGTPVMVTVAKNVDGPIKILFPRSLVPNPITLKIETSLLGLGDIILPGFFLALLLRFDAYKAKVTYFPVDVRCSFPKPYFHSALVGYFFGMSLTMFVMLHFGAAQPALLYLVPAVLGCSFATALVRGEVKELLAYSEEAEVDKTSEATAKKDN